MKPLENNKQISRRSLSRLMAVQIFYRYDYDKKEGDLNKLIEEVIDNYTIDSEDDIKSYRKNIDGAFLGNLVNGLNLVLEKIDQKIRDSLETKHNIEEISDVMLQIIRLGAFELCFMKDAPFKVIINEYCDIASSFYDAKKVNFTNAILDKIAKRENEK